MNRIYSYKQNIRVSDATHKSNVYKTIIKYN